MQPILLETVFPTAILQPLRHYLAKPAATTFANPALMLALRKADYPLTSHSSENQRILLDIEEGHQFKFAQKTYIRGTLRRTRIVCKEVSSGKSYAILAHVLVAVSEQ